MELEELSPELFTFELYNPNGLWELEDALYAADRMGYCSASRLAFKPKSDEYALMVYWPNGAHYWCHINEKMLECIKRRLARNRKSTQ